LTLRPVLALVDRLRASARLEALVAVLLVPGLVATWSFAGVIGGQIAFSGAERAGVAALRPALDVLFDAAAGRQPDLAALRAAAAEHPSLAFGEPMDAVAAASSTSERTAAAVDVITAIGNTSNLILDPDLDSFYVMDAQIVQLPKLVLAAVLASQPAPGSLPDRVAAQAVRAGELSGAATALRTGLATATKNTASPDLARQLQPPAALADAAQALAHGLSSTLDQPRAGDPGPVLAAAAAAASSATDALDQLLAARIDRLAAQRTLTLMITIGCYLLAVWLAAAVWWRTRTDVRLTLAGVTAIAGGDLVERPLPDGRDEFGDVGRALTTARGQLAAQSDQLRQSQQEREEAQQAAFLQQQSTEHRANVRAQEMLGATSGSVVTDLEDVVSHVHSVGG
jgi:hypothetical protein